MESLPQVLEDRTEPDPPFHPTLKYRLYELFSFNYPFVTYF